MRSSVARGRGIVPFDRCMYIVEWYLGRSGPAVSDAALTRYDKLAAALYSF